MNRLITNKKSIVTLLPFLLGADLRGKTKAHCDSYSVGRTDVTVMGAIMDEVAKMLQLVGLFSRRRKSCRGNERH